MPQFDEQAMQAFITDLQSGGLSYDEAKERYRELGDAIRRRYEREISALAVDVVQSEFAKGDDPLDAQMTFDAYHRWIEDVLAHYHCDGSYAWSGDGLLAVFTQPEAAVAAGRHLIDSLAMFNARYNRMSCPLQLRVGVHTGPILTDEVSGLGKIASRTFDVAGHLQKSAAPNQMRISETTYTLLRAGGPEFVPVSLDPPGPGACFAYPPHVTLMGAPALAAPPPPPPTAAAPAPQPSLVPWLLAAAGLALAVGVLLGVSALWPRSAATGAADAGTNAPTSVYRREAVAPSGEELGAPANTPAAAVPPAANQPMSPAGPGGGAAPDPGSNLPPPPATPPEWEPARRVWRSPDAESGLPPRLLPSPPELKWLLAIGVGAYQEPSISAPGAAQDSLMVADALRKSAGIPLQNARVLLDGQATLGGIKRAFQWLQQSASSGKDTVYLYVAGAAMLAPDRSDLKHTGGSGYALFPHDVRLDNVPGTGVYGADLADWLGATRAQTIVLVLDTNHAATCDLPRIPDPGRTLALLTSTGAFQRAREQKGQQAGAFAELLAKALAGAADQDRDGRVALSEVKSYLDLELGRATLGAQTPDLQGGFGGAVPELYFSALRR